MHDEISAYPLCWPKGQPRTKYRVSSRFRLSPDRCRREMLEQLRMLGTERVIVSTNVELRRDGHAYAGRRPPDDPGVAVYWRDIYNGQQMCIACDQYTTVPENMNAIAKTVDALRAIQRHGGSQLLERAFTGFKALPAPIEAGSPWWEVLGVTPNATREQIRDAKLRLSRELHPDITGGDAEKAARLALVNAAADEAMRATT